MAAALLQVARRLCFRLGKTTGLFEPTAAQKDDVNRAVLESIKIDDFDDYALKAFWRHRQTGDAPGLTHAQVTEILKAVCEMQKIYGITSK